MNNLKLWCKREVEDYKVLLRNVPSIVMIFFALSVVLMNLLANRELLNVSFLALDCGFVLSWMSFLCMDMLTKRFGAKAAIKLSFISIGFNLITCGIFFVVTRIPGNWGAFYDSGNLVANQALDQTVGGTWYVLLGSTIAMAVAAIVNAVLNVSVGKMLKHNNFKTYAIRSYVSTMAGQFVDNFVFAVIVSKVFFGWTWTQVLMCSVTGAIAELVAEIIFSPIGFKVCKKWEKDNVGQQYIEYAAGMKILETSKGAK